MVSLEELKRTSLNLHANTWCASSNMIALELTGEKVNVYPFSENLPAVQEVPITTALMIWKSPMTGEVWMLVIHNALHFGDRLKMESLLELLICPEEIARYQAGLLREVELTEDAPWESTLRSLLNRKLQLSLRVL